MNALTSRRENGAISIFEDGPNDIRQITYGRSQTTEYGNLRELVQMYVEAGGRFSEDFRPFVERFGRTDHDASSPPRASLPTPPDRLQFCIGLTRL
jgi:hypothetical protein